MSERVACHVELPSTNPKRTEDFLNGLFSWNFREFPDGSVMFGAPGYTGRISKVSKFTPDVAPRLHVTVADLAPYVERVVALGGRVAVRRREIPGKGFYAKVVDPDGNVIELLQPAKRR